jgi:simple sugar transport system ATP-binding protein
MQGIVKKFPGVVANDGVELQVRKGEIHSLLGENGAGKTTLMKILSGFYQPDEGTIMVNGERVQLRSPRDALDHGIGMIHQHFELVPNLTVTENIVLGLPGPLRLRMDQLEAHVAQLSAQYGLSIDPRATIWALSVGEQQRVEILRMLFRNIDVLIMDEPTAVLTPQEIERLFRVMRQLKHEGKSVIFITHKLEEVVEVSDYITVLRRGKVMSTVRPEKVRRHDGTISTELARMMVGREVILEVGKSPMRTERTLLDVRNLSVRGDRGESAVNDVSFTIRFGEIFAVLGVAGNGQRELVEAIVGLRPSVHGRILLEGEDIGRRRDRVAYVPEDRVGRGSIADLPLMDNFVLTRQDAFARGPLIDWKQVEVETRRSIEAFHVAAPDLDTRARQLSGGNLQRFIIARELSRQPALLIAEQPTRGLDVAATEEVWQALLRQRQWGGILLVSGDLREVLSLADRILVIFRGDAMAVLSTEDENELDRIGPLMAGVATT